MYPSMVRGGFCNRSCYDQCAEPLPVGKARHIDHDHQTGKVRGVLCSRCNMALGLLHDSPATLARLIEYLQR